MAFSEPTNSMSDMATGIPVACNRDCGATCALVAQIQGGSSYRLTSNPLNHPLKKPCPRGLRAIESRNAPDRLTRPLIRTGTRGSGHYREISWNEALTSVADRLSEILDTHGPEALLNMGGSGACKGAVHNTSRLLSRFLNFLGPVTRLEGSYSFQAASMVLPYAYGGSSIGYDARTLLDTRFVVLWGANIADTRFGNESEQVIRQIKSQGGEVIVVDPRNSRTAKDCATQWIPILPGTDSAAMLAVSWVLISKGYIDVEFIETYVHGYEEFRRYVMGEDDGIPKTPAWAEPICGIPSPVLTDLAERFGKADPAALVPGFSIQRALGGEDAFRMSVALQAISGNTGKSGGTPGTNMWFGLPSPAVPVISAGNASGAVLKKATWPEAIIGGTGGGYAADIKAAYITGANYLNQGSDIGKNIKAFETLDFIVCHELFMTPTAKYADIILPATHYLERSDIILPADNYVYYSSKVFEPIGETRNDFDIFHDLSELMGTGEAFSEGLSADAWVKKLINGSDVGADGAQRFLETGVFDGGDHERYGLSEFISDPASHPLDTPSGKIEISSDRFAETGFPAWPIHRPLPVDDQHPLMLITPHARFRINSTGSNLKWVKNREPIRLWINPTDAQSRGITDGDVVRVKNGVGKIDVQTMVTDDITPGVVSCNEGGWLGVEGDAAVNVLSPIEPTLPSFGTRTHSIFVEVEKKK